MTPEQRARFLYTDMFAITVDDYCAQQCALRAVDEVINSGLLMMLEDEEYWNEVKQQIKQL